MKKLPLIVLYVTFPNLSSARRLGKRVVEEKLASCVNILGKVESIYRWKQTLHQEKECAVLLKAPKHRASQLTQRIAELHPYDCPCIVQLPIESGYEPYLTWLAGQCKAQ